MSKKRIFFLINSMEGGGAERVISNIVSKLQDIYEIDIITLKEGLFYDIPEGVRVIPLSRIQNNLGLIFIFPILLWRFKKILKANQYDSGISFLEIANFINILANHRAIISFRTNIEVFKGCIGFVYKKLIKFFYPRAHTIIVNSEENRYDLAEYLNVPIEKIVTIYNPINLDEITRLSHEPLEEELMKTLAGKKAFITVGRLVKDDDIGSKNHSLVIKTIQELIQRGEKNIAYLIVGDGPAMNTLKKQVLENNLSEYVFFVGKQKNVFTYLAHSDYVIYASRNEGFPNALIEAIAVGIPIITTNFKTGAHEVILGNYTKSSTGEYPLFGPNGVILEFEHFQEQFFEIYPKLDTLKQSKQGIEHFTDGIGNFEKILSHPLIQHD